MSPVEDKELKKQLDEYLAHGWIEPVRSAFGAGVLFVSKHDGGLRLDYRRLNGLTLNVSIEWQVRVFSTKWT